MPYLLEINRIVSDHWGWPAHLLSVWFGEQDVFKCLFEVQFETVILPSGKWWGWLSPCACLAWHLALMTAFNGYCFAGKLKIFLWLLSFPSHILYLMWPVKDLLYFRHSLPSLNPDLSFVVRRRNGVAGRELLRRRLQSQCDWCDHVVSGWWGRRMLFGFGRNILVTCISILEAIWVS